MSVAGRLEVGGSAAQGTVRRSSLSRVIQRYGIAIGILSLVGLCFAPVCAAQATIYVTTTVQGVTDPSDCSLQEAIYSSEFASNIAIGSTDPDRFYATGCVAGTGNGDTIVLPLGATFLFTADDSSDAYNATGPTATPIIFSRMTIEGNGSTLERAVTSESEPLFRLFAVGNASITTPQATFSGNGDLTLKNVYIIGFGVKGGDGGDYGGGGGLGAGGAIYVQGPATLTVANSTFYGNGATGGNGNGCGDCGEGGGGGGLSGKGGKGLTGASAGGGGGGARGDGGDASGTNTSLGGGGGGGGTVESGGNGTEICQVTPTSMSCSSGPGPGGYRCGGKGGDPGENGHGSTCAGGGGGGGGWVDYNDCNLGADCLGDGASGGYGGGGGAGAFADGGNGGFGGGGAGGAGNLTASGGHGGFGGGGGGACCASIDNSPGGAGPFGGNAIGSIGGGGGALGGAIFSDRGIVTVRNSTFANNGVQGGSGGSVGQPAPGKAAGGAIFAVNGYLAVQNSTISGNQQNDIGGGGITFYTFDFCGGGNCVPISFCNSEGVCLDSSANRFTLDNTIVANNGPKECQVIGTPDDNISLTVSGAGNLIMQNDSGGPCPGVVSTSDPNLQPLTLNSPGTTPTIAILANSPAKDTADSGAAIADGIYTDQRGVGRPQDGKYDIGAYEARDADFSFSMLPAIPVGLGGSVTVTVAVNSFEYFTAPVTLTVPTTPAGVSVSFSSNPVTPSANGSAPTTMTITLAPTVTPGSYTPMIQGNAPATATSAALMHSLSPTIVVSATAASISTVINDFVTGGSIDNSGIQQALISKLTTAQAYIKIGDNTDAISTLGAMINQLNAQSGKHITAPAAAILITDTQALQSSLSH